MIARHFSRLALILALLSSLLAQPAFAETGDQPAAVPPVAEPVGKGTEPPKTLIANWKLQIDQIEAGMARRTMSNDELEAARVRADQIRQGAIDLAAEQTPRLAAVQARLKQLAAPKADPNAPQAAESDDVKDERKAQEALAADLDALVKQSGVIQLQAEEIIKTVADERRDRFNRTLFAKTRSLLDPSLWLDAAVGVPRTLSSLALLFHDWAGLLVTRATDSAWALIGLSMLVFAALVSPVRRRLVIATERDTSVIEPAALRKALAALAIVVVNVGLPLGGLMAIQWTLRVLELSPDRIDQTVGALLDSTIAAMGLSGLAFAILAPSKPQWRMVSLPDMESMRLNRLFLVLAVFYGLGVFLADLASTLFAPAALGTVLTGTTALVDVIFVMMVLRTLARAMGAEPLDAGDAPDAVPARSAFWRWLLPLAWVAAFSVIVSAAIGYVALARFIVSEMVWAASVLAFLFILLIVIDEAISAFIRPETRASEILVRSMGLTQPTVEQLGVILSGLIRIAVIIGAIIVILWPLGFSVMDVRDYGRQAFYGFKVGGLTISISAFLFGLVVFVGVLATTRVSQRWLEESFLPRTQIDSGLKNSIRTALGYAGFVLAVTIGLSSAGINLENVAIVAGALSVGIGLGLQSVVNNFVSGLILLVERPIKTGDVVEVGAEKGTVRKINVRSTEIETFDRASLFLPNSTLIMGAVKNWMHRDLSGRSQIDLIVPHGTDPELVKTILLKCAADHPLVVVFPSPGAFLIGFETIGMKFRLSCTVGHVNDAFSVESDLRFAALKALKEKNIALADGGQPLKTEELAAIVDRLLDLRIPKTPALQPPAPQGNPSKDTTP